MEGKLMRACDDKCKRYNTQATDTACDKQPGTANKQEEKKKNRGDRERERENHASRK